MNIGIITTWFERGAAYVSKQYRDNLVKEGHNVFIYARGGEQYAKKNSNWDFDYVTWGKKYNTTYIDPNHFFNWINNNKLEALLFNEQQDFRIVVETKKKYKNIKLASYIDYYTENTLRFYNIYDFVICNTKRHFEAMSDHPQKYYLKWGTDINVFKPIKKNVSNKIIFFHSAGMSLRKGTDILINTFINYKLYEKSKLIIHTQISIKNFTNIKPNELEKFNIFIISKTVHAPGLYHLGNVYVYPTRLEGVGLTIYEALACGLPVLTTNYPPMNEIINSKIGRLVKVKRNYCRSDGYYWPMSLCDEKDLANAMNFYINNCETIKIHSKNARKFAEHNLDWEKQSKKLSRIFENSAVRKIDNQLCRDITNFYSKKVIINSFKIIEFIKKIIKNLKGE